MSAGYDKITRCRYGSDCASNSDVSSINVNG